MAKFGQGLFETDVFDLRSKQSVRATFKLTRKAIDSLGLVALHMGIKQKYLFDHIIEDAATLKVLARQIQVQKFKKKIRVQKTYVLSRKTIDILEAISVTHDLPRDALVEYSIMQLESVILTEKENHKKRKQLFKEVVKHFDQGKELFTTLTTTTRKMSINKKPVLVSDTVGFISKLAAYLIDAFKSTLEELLYTDVVIVVIDISDDEPELKKKFQ